MCDERELVANMRQVADVTKRCAIFLDLQGTLGVPGLGDVREFGFYPFAFEAVRLINVSGLLAIVVTNQRRSRRGMFSCEEYEACMSEIEGQLRRRGAYFDAFYCRPHEDADGCDWKKPRPSLIERAAREFNIDVQRSYVVGDMGSADMVLTAAVGAKRSWC